MKIKLSVCSRRRGAILLVTLAILFGGMMVISAFYTYYSNQAEIAKVRCGEIRDLYWAQAQSKLIDYKSSAAMLGQGGLDPAVYQRIVTGVFSRDPAKMGLPQSLNNPQ